jgi:putative phage-type endonuclease
MTSDCSYKFEENEDYDDSDYVDDMCSLDSEKISLNHLKDDELKEQIIYILEEMKENINYLTYSDYKFDENMKNYILENLELNLNGSINEEQFNFVYDNNIEDLCIQTNFILRSFKKEFNHNKNNYKKLKYLKSIKQPEQKTDEWYIFRQKHITGSNAWKIFGSKASVNQLMYEKLQPMEQSIIKNSLSENSLSWGNKYEPLSIKLYEYFNDVKVEEYGCIPHKKIPFLAASPDGIIVSRKNNGRMLEIKNVVSREITQIPKMEYYIQMQIQMEVCDLDECDFFETKFVEYDNYDEFVKDKYTVLKGMIIVIVEDNSKFIYFYSPLFKNSQKELDAFTKGIFKELDITYDITDKNSKYKWFKNSYWKLEKYSCVYVPRNKLWFKEAYPILENFWNKVKEEQEKKDENIHLKYKSKPRTNTNIKKDVSNIIELI